MQGRVEAQADQPGDPALLRRPAVQPPEEVRAGQQHRGLEDQPEPAGRGVVEGGEGHHEGERGGRAVGAQRLRAVRLDAPLEFEEALDVVGVFAADEQGRAGPVGAEVLDFRGRPREAFSLRPQPQDGGRRGDCPCLSGRGQGGSLTRSPMPSCSAFCRLGLEDSIHPTGLYRAKRDGERRRDGEPAESVRATVRLWRTRQPGPERTVGRRQGKGTFTNSPRAQGSKCTSGRNTQARLP